MPGQTQIKIFHNSDYDALEAEVNTWLGKSDKNIQSVQHSCMIGTAGNIPISYITILYTTK